jgi:hypothetical protein
MMDESVPKIRINPYRHSAAGKESLFFFSNLKNKRRHPLDLCPQNNKENENKGNS